MHTRGLCWSSVLEQSIRGGYNVREERQLAERRRQAGRVGAGCLQLFACVAVWVTRMQVYVKAREQPCMLFSRCHIIFSDRKSSKLAGQYP